MNDAANDHNSSEVLTLVVMGIFGERVHYIANDNRRGDFAVEDLAAAEIGLEQIYPKVLLEASFTGTETEPYNLKVKQL